MKKLIYFIFILLVITSCSSTKNLRPSGPFAGYTKNKPVKYQKRKHVRRVQNGGVYYYRGKDGKMHIDNTTIWSTFKRPNYYTGNRKYSKTRKPIFKK